MKDAAAFLRGKLRDVPVSAIAFSQAEALLVALVGWVPGVPGFVVRTLFYKMLFKRLSGMAWIGGITMGDYVLIGSNVTISSGRHTIEGRMPPVFARPAVPLPIVIEDDVWIGAGAVIMPGIRLRRGTVVGANAVVTRDTEEYSVMIGVPARKIRTRDAEA
jgi:NDP-sugar pyrophosphorylase family protein